MLCSRLRLKILRRLSFQAEDMSENTRKILHSSIKLFDMYEGLVPVGCTKSPAPSIWHPVFFTWTKNMDGDADVLPRFWRIVKDENGKVGTVEVDKKNVVFGVGDTGSFAVHWAKQTGLRGFSGFDMENQSHQLLFTKTFLLNFRSEFSKWHGKQYPPGIRQMLEPHDVVNDGPDAENGGLVVESAGVKDESGRLAGASGNSEDDFGDEINSESEVDDAILEEIEE